jgi:hypothetical protein
MNDEIFVLGEDRTLVLAEVEWAIEVPAEWLEIEVQEDGTAR